MPIRLIPIDGEADTPWLNRRYIWGKTKKSRFFYLQNNIDFSLKNYYSKKFKKN